MSRVTIRQANAEYKPFGTLPKGALFMWDGGLYQKVEFTMYTHNAGMIGEDSYLTLMPTDVVQHVDVDITIRPAK